MEEFKWPVMPLCKAQLQDINPDDVLNGGLYRRCNTYKGGGGYDQFPAIYERRFGKTPKLNDQFVVQLRGCPLNCPYCYVTSSGIWGEPTHVSTSELVRAFEASKCGGFHLMGGAPAIYMCQWEELLEQLNGAVFHSDLLLFERVYGGVRREIHRLANYPHTLYAVSIKGATRKEYLDNTNTKVDMHYLWYNLDVLVESGLNFYFTFTGMSPSSIEQFKDQVVSRYKDPALLEDAFAIELVHYKALDYKE